MNQWRLFGCVGDGNLADLLQPIQVGAWGVFFSKVQTPTRWWEGKGDCGGMADHPADLLQPIQVGRDWVHDLLQWFYVK